MTLLLRILSSFLIALLAGYVIGVTNASAGAGLNLSLLGIVFTACLATSLLSPFLQRMRTPTPPMGGGTAGREQGEIKWFNVSKGYGFITRQSGEDVFVHFRSIRGNGRRNLRDGQRVEFIVVDSEKGPQAEEVEILSGP